MRGFPTIAVSTILLALSAGVAPGSDLFWNDAVSGRFDEATRWSPPVVPAADDRAIFLAHVDGPVPYSVSFQRDVTNERVDIGDDVTFELDGFRYTIQFGLNPFQTSLLLAGGHLTVADGMVDVVSPPDQTSVVIETNSELSITESAELRTTGDLEFGVADFARGAPRITIDQGSMSVGGQSRITHPVSEAIVEVNGSQSTWSSGGSVIVGQAGKGVFRVRDGGTAHVNHWSMLGADSGEGEITVGGLGSSWSNSDQLIIGSGGHGTLTVSDGGAVSSSGLISGVLGTIGGSTGEVHVSDPGSNWTNEGALWVGVEGQGTLAIGNGGTVSSSMDVSGVVGVASGGRGEISVSGNGSKWTNSGQLLVGDGGRAALAVREGGAVVVDSATSVGHRLGSHGEITVTGPESRWTQPFDQLIVGYQGVGQLTVSDGAKLDTATRAATSGVIGGSATGIGTATITGPGSQWDNHGGRLVVGYSGQGNLEIAVGGTVQSAGGVVGNGPGAAGTVVVSGHGSNWTSTDQLTVGSEENSLFDGSGLVLVSDGGRVAAPTIWTGPSGQLAGEGVFQGSILNAGIVTPGDALGELFIQGDYIQEDPGTLEIQVAGSQSGQFDAIVVSGQVDLGGTLRVSLGELPTFRSGDTFPVLRAGAIVGGFSDVFVPTTEQGESLFAVSISSSLVTLSALRDVFSPEMLRAGDADMNLEFDQLDLVQVLRAGKYLTGEPSTWGEGDWNGAPGGLAGQPPAGDGVFDQLDIVAAQAAGVYMQGPYGALTLDAIERGGQGLSVGVADTSELAANNLIGAQRASIETPEPTSAVLLAIGMALGLLAAVPNRLFRFDPL